MADQIDLFGEPEKAFGGKTYDAPRDYTRLKSQLERTWKVMLDGRERTLEMIAKETTKLRPDSGHDLATAVSARIRDFRKAKFGKHLVVSRNGGGGLWWYRLVTPENDPTFLLSPMPDNSTPPPLTNARLDAFGRIIHDVCAVEGCPEKPSVGVGSDQRKGHLGMWFCFAHRPNP